MHAIAIVLHVFGAVVWVGGMFVIYVCLRPALGVLEPAQRLTLLRATLAKFFPWVWAAVLLLLLSGYWMIFSVFGGFGGVPVYVNFMQLFGFAMIGLFAWLFHGPWLKFKRAVDAQDWPAAASHLELIRQIISANMPLGLIVIAIGASGRFL